MRRHITWIVIAATLCGLTVFAGHAVTAAPERLEDSASLQPGSQNQNPSTTQAGPKGERTAKAATKAQMKIKLKPPKISPQIKNSRAEQAGAATLALLQRQRQAANAEAAQMKLGIRPIGQKGVPPGPSQTMSAAGGGKTSAPAPSTAQPYFLSPVSNYYGLNGTVAVMRQGLPGPVAGQDQFTLQMAPGWVVESTQTDLLVSNTSADVTSKPASVSGNTITVTYPVLPYGSGNTTSYYSIYGLKIWVTGPVGVTP
jgi:hypothetical protein